MWWKSKWSYQKKAMAFFVVLAIIRACTSFNSFKDVYLAQNNSVGQIQDNHKPEYQQHQHDNTNVNAGTTGTQIMSTAVGHQQKSTNTMIIPINSNSTMAKDIANITHLPNESKIIINLNKNRTCQQPNLIGRLSGPALIKLEWEEMHEHNDEHEDVDILVGHYNVPMPGRFFIEIIVTLCIQLKNDTDVKPMCLEDPHRNRLTDEEASIDAMAINPLRTSQEHSSTPLGYWYSNQKEEDHAPMHTRWQPTECRYDKNSTHCMKFVQLSQFEPYYFNFTRELSAEKILAGKEGVICYAGASHARVFSERTAQALLPFENATNVNVTAPLVDRKRYITFAHWFKRSKIQEMIDRKCTKVIIGTGQWDAGWKKRHPTTFSNYKLALETVMGDMVEMFGNASVDLYFRTTHYNPIAARIAPCPTQDWRFPPVIDEYNKITKKVCDKFGVPLIDTREIHGVVWDRAEDFCHYDDISGDAEVLYVLDKIFGSPSDEISQPL